MPKYTFDEITHQLDQCAEGFVFPMLDNGYDYLADVRLSAFRDESHWAIIIEVLACHNRAYQLDALSNCLYCFGNCLKNPPGTANENFLYPIDDGSTQTVFSEANDDDDPTLVRQGLLNLRIREQIVGLDLSVECFVGEGIELEDAPAVHDFELLRWLAAKYQHLLFATSEELQERISKPLPLILRLEKWHHPDLAQGEIPSQSETFRMIADVLVTGDRSHFKPTFEPNTHWRNWPEGGTL